MKMEARSSSTSSFFGSIGGEDNHHLNQQMLLQQFSSTTAATTTSSSSAPTQPPPKKRRNQPGTPNPDAEIVALSPRTLMATNRFICEVCNKGFQREQNLQLHRRGHNLPWKLKQKSNKDQAVTKKKVYVCPENTCVHHDPSRALGDLTGIKKHFFRKHGEKKWKCDKCSKRYAVHSDWKAHSKTCGTREYRCDCGTLFSRRDSFITHRAFCDALAQEGARNPSSLNAISSHLYGNNASRMSLGLSQLRSPQFSSFQDSNNNNNNPPNNNMFIKQHIPTPTTQTSTMFFMQQDANQLGFQDQQHQPGHANNLASFASKPPLLHHHGLTQLPDLQANATNDVFNLGFFSGHGSSNTTANPGFLSPIAHQFSSTANVDDQEITFFSTNNVGENNQAAGGDGISYSLFSPSLQHNNTSNNAHISATGLLQKAAQIGSTGSTTNNNSTGTLLRGLASSSSSNNLGGQPIDENNDNNLQGLMSSLVNGAGASNIFYGGQAHNGNLSTGYAAKLENFDEAELRRNLAVTIGGSDRLTLDFLGVGGMVSNVGSNRGGREQQIDVSLSNSSLESEMKSSLACNPFGRD